MMNKYMDIKPIPSLEVSSRSIIGNLDSYKSVVKKKHYPEGTPKNAKRNFRAPSIMMQGVH